MNLGGLVKGGCVAGIVVAGMVVSVDGGTQLVQHSGMSHSIIQSTTNVWRGLGRRPHNSLATDPVNPFPDRPIKPKMYAIEEETDDKWKGCNLKNTTQRLKRHSLKFGILPMEVGMVPVI